ncbi:ribonuclease HI [Aliiroseovarius sp. S2029]|uniref:ribonuclease HI n=1 Tax=Aliiroseovarius sp. S2029 TaxID=2936988 RepID=UPI0020BDBD42|nr:ribonuclease HI [Aliiroseovarius sp. S2029]MCK8484330.1 ribonuclease HI [Aliiroseovarius sp. S2029]
MTTSEFTIHTDGSCIGNPGKGGCAAIIRRYERDTEIEKLTIADSAVDTTNNRMELEAALNGLKQIKRDEKARVTVYSDSQYLINGMTKWLLSWQQKGWRGSNGKNVKNRDLWEALIAVCEGLDVHWVWVRGHDGDIRNEEADKMAFAMANAA